MLATIINALAILIGGVVGLLFKKHISASLRDIVFIAAGMICVVLGIMMSLKAERILYLALSLVGGGIIGTALHIEDVVFRMGEALRRFGLRLGRRTEPVSPDIPVLSTNEAGSGFATGFLEASVLFCVGSMAILGSIQAGTVGDYKILLTKSVLDGVVAVLLAAGLGAGVLASALPIIIYQGAITLLAGVLQPWISPLMLTMISSVGGPMVLMIGVNLLGLRKIPTANFLPALVFAIVFAIVDPYMPAIFRT